MTQKTTAIPAGYHSVTPYMIIKDAARAMEFYKKAFGAKEVCRMDSPEGKINHAEIKIGDSHIMLADEFPEMGAFGPNSTHGSPITLLIYIEDVDKIVNQAVSLGGTLVRPVEDQFYGDRSGIVRDPFGHTWCISTHIEDVTPEEIDRRVEKMKNKKTECC